MFLPDLKPSLTSLSVSQAQETIKDLRDSRKRWKLLGSGESEQEWQLIPSESAKFALEPEGDPKSAELAIVGEAAGRTEAAKRRHFCGESGLLLDEWLRAVGYRGRLQQVKTGRWQQDWQVVGNSRLYVTNVVLEQPPGNRIAEFIDLSTRTITRAGQEYLNFLEKDITRLGANTILAVGNVAMWALTGEIGITARRGSMFPCRFDPSKKVIPILHPAALLHTYGSKERIDPIAMYVQCMDIQKAKSESLNAEPCPARELKIDPTWSQAMAYVESLRGTAYGFDYETPCGAITVVGMARSETDGLTIALHDGEHNVWSLERETDFWREIGLLMEDEESEMIAQNAAFEMHQSFWNFGFWPRRFWDTMGAQRILYPDLSADLGFNAAQWTRWPYHKEESKTFQERRTWENWRSFLRYNCADATVLHPIRDGQIAVLEKRGNLEQAQTQAAGMPMLMYMSMRGVKTDMEGLRRQKEEAITSRDKLMIELRELIPVCPISRKDHRITMLDNRRVLADSLEPDLLTSQGEPSIMKLRKAYGKERCEQFKSTAISKSYGKITIFCVDTELDPRFAGSSDQQKRLFYDYLGHKPYKRRGKLKAGQSSSKMDEEARRKLAQKGVEPARVLNKIAKHAKLISTYYNEEKFPDGRLHCFYDVFGTRFTRYSSKEDFFGRGMNLQNQPPAMKKLFEADY